jgi:muramoyltetrapeptide carboxypeptidase
MRLGVFAPSSPFSDERFQRGLDRLRSFDADIFVHPQSSEKHGYLAGRDEARLDAFHTLLADPSIDAIIAARGGYGAHRIIDRVDFDLVRRTKKPLIGFSDVCAIHSACLERLGPESFTAIHAPVVTQFGEVSDEDARSLFRVLAGELDALTLEGVKPSIAPGRAIGPLTGGNLAVYAPLIGTKHFYLPDGAIFLIEDVTEAPYRVDRMLTHLREAKVFDRVAGIALGEFVGCEPPRPNEQTIDDVLADRLGDLGIPVIAGLPIGHGKRNHAVRLGAIVAIDAEARTLTFKTR